MPEYVTLKDLAEQLGIDRSNVRKYVVKHGLNPVSVRTPGSRGQLTLALTAADAEAVRALRDSQGFGESVNPVENGDGYFYVVQLVPELDPNRVKLGFAVDTGARLDAHRTAAPTAVLLKAWRCKRSWEGAAIASITRAGCQLIANEVYQVDDLGALVEWGDAFFGLMP